MSNSPEQHQKPAFPQQLQPTPPKKRKKWPWIVAGVFVVLVIFGAAGTQGSESPSAGASNADATASRSQAQHQDNSTQSAGSSNVTRLSFGETYTWTGGEAVSISAPTEYTVSNRFLAAPEGKRYVAFDVTVTNNGADEYNVMSTALTVQHHGQVAQQNYTAGDTLPNVELPPGGSTTFTAVYEIGEVTGKLQVSVKPNAFASNTVYFTGQF